MFKVANHLMDLQFAIAIFDQDTVGTGWITNLRKSNHSWEEPNAFSPQYKPSPMGHQSTTFHRLCSNKRSHSQASNMAVVWKVGSTFCRIPFHGNGMSSAET
jgi:hypothetical protein